MAATVIETKTVNTLNGVILDADKASALALRDKRSQFVCSPIAYSISKRIKGLPELQTFLNTAARVPTQQQTIELSSTPNYQILADSIRITGTVQFVVPNFNGGADQWDLSDNNTTRAAAGNAASGLLPPTATTLTVPTLLVGEQLSEVRSLLGNNSSSMQQAFYNQKKLVKLQYPTLFAINDAMLKRRKLLANPSCLSVADNYAAGPTNTAFLNVGHRRKTVTTGTDVVYFEEPLFIEGLTSNNALFSLWTDDFEDARLLPPGATLQLQLTTSDSTTRWLLAEAKMRDVVGGVDLPIRVQFVTLNIEYDVIQTTVQDEHSSGTEVLNRLKVEGPENIYGTNDSPTSGTVTQKSVAMYQFTNTAMKTIAINNAAAGSVTTVWNPSTNDPVPDMFIIFIGPASAFTDVGRQTFNQSLLRYARPNCITKIAATDMGERATDAAAPFTIFPSKDIDMTLVANTSNNLRLALNKYAVQRCGVNNSDNWSALELFCYEADEINNRTSKPKGYRDNDGLTFPVGTNGQSHWCMLRPQVSECINRDFIGPRSTGSVTISVTYNDNVLANDQITIIGLYRHSLVIGLADEYNVSEMPKYITDDHLTTVYGMYVDTKQSKPLVSHDQDN
jgi:hypothetical protein